MNTPVPTMPPLFIPLRLEFYRAFDSGAKTEDYRVYGPRWNERTCLIGRRARLSCGYGRTHRRLFGVVVGFRIENDGTSLPGWSACYGDTPRPASVIVIEQLPVLAAIRCLAFEREGERMVLWPAGDPAKAYLHEVFYERNGVRELFRLYEYSEQRQGGGDLVGFAGKSEAFAKAYTLLERFIRFGRESKAPPRLRIK